MFNHNGEKELHSRSCCSCFFWLALGCLHTVAKWFKADKLRLLGDMLRLLKLLGDMLRFLRLQRSSWEFKMVNINFTLQNVTKWFKIIVHIVNVIVYVINLVVSCVMHVMQLQHNYVLSHKLCELGLVRTDFIKSVINLIEGYELDVRGVHLC